MRFHDHSDAHVPSVYFREEYGRAEEARSDRSTWTLLRSDDGNWQIPMIITRDQVAVDAASPYGYSGIYAKPTMSAADVREHWSQTIDTLKSAGIVSLFLRFMPFQPHHSALADLRGLDLIHTSDTVVVDCLDEATMWDRLKGKSRTAIRKAQNLGFTFTVDIPTYEHLSHGSNFARLYNATMNRARAASGYFFPADYYRQLTRLGPSGLRLVTVTNADGEVAATSIVLLDKKTVHYHLSGSEPELTAGVANNLLIWAILIWASKHGYDNVHLGGGLQPGDSLYNFKASFGGNSSPYFIGRAVINDTQYAALNALRAAKLHTSVSALASTDYFPAYRATV